jgi:hypothetical protein
MASPWKDIGRYGSVGIEFVLTIALASGLGYWLDARYWGGRGWGLGAGFVLGVAVGFRNLVRTANQMQRDIERAEAKDPEAHRWTVDSSWIHRDEPPPGDRASDSPDSAAGTTDGTHASGSGKRDNGRSVH